ncbi:MAG: helix-turn-helix domain containing protein [candidate division Zixibacteria bacterium]|nr:TetR/AcrR family transcriptional regulator [candidate division Zixibacteria bacterium]MDD4918065.1 helix-turn-helix domain containing protein [candidate division Zixibacteria bacterium]MDM7971999.1 helix-turn-helix domain-containing protein [candidate division Zixibacteria bacterium]
MANRQVKKRIRQSPKRPAGERRDQLLRAAHELFLRQGYRATSTDEIARRAGLTKGAFYFHFASKEDILMTFVQDFVEGHTRAMERLAGKRLTPAGLLAELGRIDARMPLREARKNLSLLAEIMYLPRFRALIRRAYERSVAVMAECLDPGYGRTAAQRRRLVELMHAIYDGVCFAGMVHPQLGNFERQLETFRRLTAKKRIRSNRKHGPAKS